MCDQGQCKPILCKPGDKSCNGTVVQQCDAKGLAQTALADCAKTGEVCSNGGCVKLLCTPNSTSCQGGQLAICTNSGLDWIKIDCPSGKVCDQGQCKDTVCTPGNKQCADKVVETCDAKGLGYTATQDCAKTGQVCDKGTCKSLVCTPNAASCQGGQLALCLNDGLSWYLTDCVSGKVCDQGLCKTAICAPGAKACNGNVAEQCDAKGLNMVVIADCNQTKQVCEAGVCKSPICTPKATECQAGKLAICADNGLSWQQFACGTDKVCDAGQCKDQVCKPDSSFCAGFEVHKCDAKGLSATKVVDCSAGKQACVNGACAASACWPPGSQKCAGPQVATCKADATGYDLQVCNDNDACTSNACDDKTVKCYYFSLKDCADSDICTNDGCDKQTGACFNAPISGPCDDGDGCTTGETCATGKCLPPVGYTIATLAGAEKSGTADGPAAQALFVATYSVARAADGAIWVADVHRLRKLTPQGDIVTVVGSTGFGATDGPPDKALFYNPAGLVLDGQGYLYVADRGNSRIRKVAPDGYVTTWSGAAGAGYLDGPVADAKFSTVSELAFDKASGWLYVLDTANRRLRAIKPDGQVVTLCGSGSSGYADGACSSAKFGYMEAMALLPDGNVAVYDFENYRIRLIKTDGTVTTLAGSGASGFQDGAASSAKFTNVQGMVAGPDGELYLADGARIRLLAKDQVTTLAGGGSSKQAGDALAFSLLGPMSLTWDDNKALVVGDMYALRKLTPKSAVLCDDLQPCTADACDKATGNCVFKPLSAGAKCDDFTACTANTTCDGKGACSGSAKNCDDSNACTWDGCDALTGACDNHPTAASCTDGDACTPADTCVGGKCVTDQAVVATVAGSTNGYKDGTGSVAQIGQIWGMVVDKNGDLWFADSGNHCLRKMTPQGKVTSEVGQCTKPGYTDGDAATAQFKNPWGLAFDSLGRLVIADHANHRIRLYDPATQKVSTLAGSGSPSYADGPASSAGFNYPTAVAVDSAGAVFVFDVNNYRIRKITNGTVTTVAGSGSAGKQDGAASSATFTNQVYGMAFGPDGALYLADGGNHAIRKLAAGQVSTVAGGSAGYADGPVATAKFNAPYAVGVDSQGQILVADYNNRRMRRLTTKGTVVTDTGNGTASLLDGLGTAATWQYPSGIAIAGVGSAYVYDAYRIRKSTASPIDCDDGKQCTLDKCDSKTGVCSNAPIPNGGACDDGDACTVNEACADSACKGGNAKDCDDNNPCTADSCDKVKGCANAPTNDGQPCGGGNYCAQGKCAPSPCGADPPSVCMPFAGATLLGFTQQQQLNTWYGKAGQKWQLCYKATKDGFSSKVFHTLCDAAPMSMVVMHSTSGLLFGGFAAKSWAGGGSYVASLENWLFQLNKGAKLPVQGCNSKFAMYVQASYGPTFGGGHDLHLDGGMKKGFSNLGHTYTCPATSMPCSPNVPECQGFLAGGYNDWTLDEVEVYYPVP
ncbi:MAG: SMP-30/gluconolactonase/LRE family protein [Deltaproteobacteria bacterium]|nr:SMP-30/gluconolactonase/LRE family protein [Deltaproteobacteria bacterium]